MYKKNLNLFIFAVLFVLANALLSCESSEKLSIKTVLASNLKVTPGLDSLKIDWDAQTAATYYEVIIDNSSLIVDKSLKTNTFLKTGLAKCATYKVQVKVCNESGCSDTTPAINVKTLGCTTSGTGTGGMQPPGNNGTGGMQPPGNTGTTTQITTGTIDPSIDLAIYKKIYKATSITSDGKYVIIKVEGVPDHESPYWPTTNALYAAYSGPAFGGYTFSKNPNSIASQNFTFIIPLKPAVASTHQATSLGAIGVSLNGVPFFNQYAGPNQPLTGEAASFDKYWGHPAPGNYYHYHVEPLFLTAKVTKSGLLGFLLDGFPVYGPQENGKTIQNSDLDDYHGHTSATADYPNGIYHYHITDTDPYINGNGYYGTPGTVTQ